MGRITKQEFLDRAVVAHGDKYDYSRVVFVNMETKVLITCKIHGDFLQSPEQHTATNSPRGCPQCGRESARESKRKSLDSFIARANSIHDNKYDYSKTVYVAAKEKVTITCPIHGDFQQLVSGHLSGYGCKQCTSYGKGRVSSDKPCTVYYLHLHDTGLYKLGITTRTVEERYRTAFDREQFTVVFTKQFATGQEAYDYEQALFKQHQSQLYKGPKVLHTGNTELFLTDIFEGTYP